jgi:hypothetical protein
LEANELKRAKIGDRKVGSIRPPLSLQSEIAITAAIRPIRSDADHAEALAAIEGLWQAAPGTAEDDRLEVLAILVDDYESRRCRRAD